MKASAFAAVVVVMALAACATPGASPSVGRVELTIYGAASLSRVLADAETAYQAAHPGVTITIATDSSAALRTQIEQGAPADVFLSADTSNPQALADAELTKGGLVAFAGNRLTIVVPSGNPAGIKTPADLARAGLRIVAAGDAVPITKYATQVVANLAKLTGYPAGFAASYAANVVSREDNVKAVVAKIEIGEGDAGIVYVTDAAGSSKVATVPIPDAANVGATYAGVVLRSSSHLTQAQAFLDWLAGPGGQAIMAAHGFIPRP